MNSNHLLRKALLMKLLDWDEFEYNHYQFESAFDYLDKVRQIDRFGICMLTTTKTFWIWWNNQWDRRNKILINDFQLDKITWIPDHGTVLFVRQEYALTHYIKTLNIYPNRIVMEESYDGMINQLMKTHV
jgi:hypothetical protein